MADYLTQGTTQQKRFLGIRETGGGRVLPAASHTTISTWQWDLEKALAEIDSIHSKAFWNSKMNAARNDTSSSGSSGTELKQSLEHLTLPKIEPARGVSNNDLWRTQTYADFTQKVQRKNTNTLLTKNIVDSAFRLAITRMNKGSESLPGRDSAISRCLGKESAKYWKDR